MLGAKRRTNCPLAPLLPPNNLSPYFDAFLNKAEQIQMLQILHFNLSLNLNPNFNLNINLIKSNPTNLNVHVDLNQISQI